MEDIILLLIFCTGLAALLGCGAWIAEWLGDKNNG